MPSYVVNGREYRSIDEMPAEDRQAYQQAMGLLADHDGDGLPDIFKQAGTVQSVNLNQHNVNVMHGANDQLKHVFVDLDGNGIPDILEGQTNFNSSPTSTNATPWQPPAPTANPIGNSPLPWNQPKQGNSFMLGLVVGGVVIGAALLVWLVLL